MATGFKCRLSITTLLLSLTIACNQGPKSGHGFTLPEGDVAAGEAIYTRFVCADCHTIKDRPDLRNNIEPIITITLGGKTERIQTYGELITSIINPSHKISQKLSDEIVAIDGVSKMRNYNAVMTVEELSNLVTFIQEQYELEGYTPTIYPGYSIP